MMLGPPFLGGAGIEKVRWFPRFSIPALLAMTLTRKHSARETAMARQAYKGPFGVLKPETATGTRAVRKPPTIPAQAPAY